MPDLRLLRREVLVFMRLQVGAAIGWSGEYNDVAGGVEMLTELNKELNSVNSMYTPSKRRERKDLGEEFLEDDVMSFVDLAADLSYLVR